MYLPFLESFIIAVMFYLRLDIVLEEYLILFIFTARDGANRAQPVAERGLPPGRSYQETGRDETKMYPPGHMGIGGEITEKVRKTKQVKVYRAYVRDMSFEDKNIDEVFKKTKTLLKLGVVGNVTFQVDTRTVYADSPDDGY